jgi:hypothetical protein
VNRTILIAASFLRFSDVDHGFLAEALQAGWRPEERQLPSDTRYVFEIPTMIFEIRTLDRRSRGSLAQKLADRKEIQEIVTSRM